MRAIFIRRSFLAKKGNATVTTKALANYQDITITMATAPRTKAHTSHSGLKHRLALKTGALISKGIIGAFTTGIRTKNMGMAKRDKHRCALLADRRQRDGNSTALKFITP